MDEGTPMAATLTVSGACMAAGIMWMDQSTLSETARALGGAFGLLPLSVGLGLLVGAVVARMGVKRG